MSSLACLDDARIDAVLNVPDCVAVLDDAFADLARGQAAVHVRHRTDCGATKLSTMGGLWTARGVAGVKTYPTVAGQFSFLVTLFDTRANRPLAVLEANALTRLRTTALTSLVAQKALCIQPRKLALFGAGLQGRAQAEALCAQFRFAEVVVVDPQGDDAWCARLALRQGCRVTLGDAESAVRQADMVVTATRSKVPVFDGRWLSPGALVVAMGTSLPDGRELDDATLSRAARVLVEYLPQSRAEAGEVVLGLQSGALDDVRLVDLPALYRGEQPWRASASDIVVFKSVGTGLADVACAWLAVQRA